MADSLCIHGCLPGEPCRENPCPALAPAPARAAEVRRTSDQVTAEDWLGVANSTLADGDDGSKGSPLFAALCRAVDDRNTHGMRATMAEEILNDTVVRAQENEVRAIEAERERDRLLEREQHFAKVLGVADGGQYRNDWDSRLTALVAERDKLRTAVAEMWAMARPMPPFNPLRALIKEATEALKASDDA